MGVPFFFTLIPSCLCFNANIPNRIEAASFRSIKLFFSKENVKDVDKIDKKEKVVGIDVIDATDTVKETTERMLQKETPTSLFGKPISEDMIEFNKAIVGFIKTNIFDALFTGPDRDYARFYTLENIARMP